MSSHAPIWVECLNDRSALSDDIVLERHGPRRRALLHRARTHARNRRQRRGPECMPGDFDLSKQRSAKALSVKPQRKREPGTRQNASRGGCKLDFMLSESGRDLGPEFGVPFRVGILDLYKAPESGLDLRPESGPESRPDSGAKK